MAERGAIPGAEERRAYLLKLKQFRESLSPREQRMLDAVVLASYWPGGQPEVHGYRLVPPLTIYDGGAIPEPFTDTPWGIILGSSGNV
jgi:hypothetical protein